MGPPPPAPPQLSLEVPEPSAGTQFVPRPTPLKPVAKRRCFSAGRQPDPGVTMSRRQAEQEGHCLACHTRNLGHVPHLRRGDCVGFPGRMYYAHHGVTSPATSSNENSFASAEGAAGGIYHP